MRLPPKVTAWLTEPLPADVAAAVERVARLDDVRRVSLMPDVHLADQICVGAVVATHSTILPQAVGGDIGCGVAAVPLGVPARRVRQRDAQAILRGLAELVPVRHHRGRRALPAELESAVASTGALTRVLQREGAAELGTLGRGNHFLELLADDDDALWLAVHSGSRAFGPAVKRHHLAAAEPLGGGLRGLSADSEAGRWYLHDHDLALRYASASRRAMLSAALAVVADTLGGLPGDALMSDAGREGAVVHCHHDHVRHELHDGEPLWVHRKGALSASEGERVVIPGSMGTETYVAVGRGHAPALCSCSHGAGRRMSRGEARRRISPGRLARELAHVHHDHGLARQLVEEAPSAYKPIADVMRAQGELVRVERRLRTILSYKGP